MTVTYKGRQYGHQQLWALVAAMNKDWMNMYLEMPAGEEPSVFIWIDDETDGVERNKSFWSGFGDPGDRTPFRALARAVEAMQKEGE